MIQMFGCPRHHQTRGLLAGISSGVCVHSRTDVLGATQDKVTVLHGYPPNGETLPHESFEDDEQKLHEADT